MQSGVYNIVNFVEETYSTKETPLLIPCSTSTSEYQSYLYLILKLQSINMDAIEIGLDQDKDIHLDRLQSQIEQMENIRGK